MALICRDILRDLFHFSDHSEYGLWMPADEYREESPDRRRDSTSSSIHSLSSSSSAPRASPPPPPSRVQAAWKQVAGGKSTITGAQAGHVARLLDLAPSFGDIDQLRDAQGDSITFSELENWLTRIGHAEDTPEYLVTFFQHYDTTNSGFLTETQVRNLLRTYGEPLTEVEVEAIMRELKLERSSSINYHDFVARLLN
eukprot:Gregarina_sp_Pseudo_9__5373@NODE_64_length_4638_cov_86_865188_g59_i0_p3_GENE_NODE_64_length_4638_cov_86_865188_g59_i0NODE_64_length_4638_cov_86_865188_g59_i0_p3_ORF_typecomplete_len198_score1_54EFhand_7/PF13499_6/3_3e02EFhand_7/PF13499_6/1_7e10EFhand_11/PF08976_11/4_7e03EFhand_11/PF08976_11/6_3e09EFhand_6/PF13405_6/2e03EFhand_6/PF13405_6/3_5e03EFhand_6/PF13405_6/9_3EFhand_6/PF13405_6/4_9e06EFhand_8/PF13833_6/0_2EFhand_8/PF13833_6/0_00055DUF5580/PF17743_1/0_012EFhand_9/PF14658_6/0_049YrzK/PF17449